jgi:uncharacterized protein (TIGR04442 family)
MIRDVLISGGLSDRYEYFTTVVGRRLNLRLLYDAKTEPGDVYDRFYSGGSELRIAEDGISFSGNGGSFCSYMFGVDIPEKDLLRRDVRNRLVMHGARYDEAEERLSFSVDTGGFESWSRIYYQGHAFANYFFFVDADVGRSVSAQQEALLRVAGKFLKRADLVAGDRSGHSLALSLHEAMGEANWTLFVTKVIDVHAEDYHRRFSAIYGASRSISPDERRALDQIASRLDVDAHRQERIQLEVIYTHADNKKIIDQYKDTLVAHLSDGLPDAALAPRLNLLRAFSARNAIPGAIFDRLDSVMVDMKRGEGPAEPHFITEARAILDKLFVDRVGGDLDRADIEKLLRAKRESFDRRYVGFEAVLLEAAHAADEWNALGKGTLLRTRFEQIVDYFDLFDSTSALVSSLAHLDDFELTPVRLEALLESRQLFDELRPNLFDELFIVPLETTNYLDVYGRRRLAVIKKGLDPAGAATNATEFVRSISEINVNARLHRLVDEMLRGAIGNIHEQPLSTSDKNALRRDVEARLRSDYGIAASVSENLFDLVLLCIEEEYFYAKKLLPTIIATRDLKLRENFLQSSGLDRFRVEEIEAAYLRSNIASALDSRRAG